MKYFLNTKFNKYTKQSKVLGLNVGKPIDTIELISIGIVSEKVPSEEVQIRNGLNKRYPTELTDIFKSKKYYAICKDFDVKAAWDNKCLRENVLKPIYIELHKLDTGEDIEIDKYSLIKYSWRFKITFKRLLDKYGKTRKQVAKEIIEFTNGFTPTDLEDKPNQPGITPQRWGIDTSPIEFYAYFGDYDWLLFCSLFGNKIDLHKRFPMYCKSLKQMLDTKASTFNQDMHKDLNFEGRLMYIKSDTSYPKYFNNYSALNNAKWYKELYTFINNL